MPYSGPNDPSLPSNVKKLSPKKRRQWLHVWRGVIDRGGSESSAFAQANGVVGRKDVEEDAELTAEEMAELDKLITDAPSPEQLAANVKGYVESWELMGRQYSPEDADYNPLGATSTKGCANCRWFVSPDSCVLVYGNIAPTGISKLYAPLPQPNVEPLPVTIVKSMTANEADTVTITATASAAPPPVRSDDEIVVDEKRTFTADERKKAADKGHALPDGSFPIENAQDLENAIHAIGRASNRAAAMKHIKKRAKQLGKTDMLPDTWSKELSLEASFVERVRQFASSLNPFAAREKSIPAFWYTKQADGRLRWFATMTNNYEDRERQILTKAAHADYVEWVNAEKAYPELWLWHAGPASKWGETDWVDLTDEGFVAASGLVDEGSEEIAERIAAEKDVGVSHGYIGLQTKDGKYITKYRSFEISALPLKNAANVGTGFSVEEIESMAFTKERKEWLAKLAGSEDVVGRFEKSNEQLAEKMKSLGLAYKDFTETDEQKTPPAESEAPLPTFIAAVTSLSDAVTQLAGQVTAVAAKQTTLDEQLAAAQKSLDTRVEEVFTSKIQQTPRGFSPSSDPSTIVAQKEATPAPASGQDLISAVVAQAEAFMLGRQSTDPDKVANGAESA